MRKFGDVASESSASDLVGCNGPYQHVGLGRLNGCTAVAFGFKGPERGSKWGPVVNNCENIASEKQRLGMRLRNLRVWEATGPVSM